MSTQNSATSLHSFSPKSLARSRLILAVVFGAFALMVVLAARATGWSTIWNHIQSLPPHGWALLVIAPALNSLIRFPRYLLGAQQLQLPTIPASRWGLYYVAGMALMATPGKVGVALRLWLLQRHHSIPLSRSAPLFGLDVLTDAAAALILVTLPILLGATFLPTTPFFILTLFGTAILLGLISYRHRLPSLPKKIQSWQPILRPKRLLICITLSAVAVVAQTLLFHPLLSLLDIHTITSTQLLFITTAAILVGMAAMLPAGLGGTEATMVALLHLHGAPLPAAIAFTALYRTSTLWLPTLSGLVVLPWALKKYSQLHNV